METGDRLLEAALAHVAFDGWTEASFRAAVEDAGVEMALARGLYPRGALDMAVRFHRGGDAAMVARLQGEDLANMRFRDRVTHAVRTRIECVEDREAVRRGATLFALPLHAAEGAALIWGTSDQIWTVLGDSSRDLNWYSKRATLSGVYSATLLYWLGDDSLDNHATWEFLERRIANVMKIEQVKSGLRKGRLTKGLMAGPDWLASRIKAPEDRGVGVPGGWVAPRD